MPHRPPPEDPHHMNRGQRRNRTMRRAPDTTTQALIRLTRLVGEYDAMLARSLERESSWVKDWKELHQMYMDLRRPSREELRSSRIQSFTIVVLIVLLVAVWIWER